jgi:hypothetical protein
MDPHPREKSIVNIRVRALTSRWSEPASPRPRLRRAAPCHSACCFPPPDGRAGPAATLAERTDQRLPGPVPRARLRPRQDPRVRRTTSIDVRPHSSGVVPRRRRAARCWGRPFNGQAKLSRGQPCWETEELENECGKAGAWEEEPGDSCSILVRIPHATCPDSTVRSRTSRDALCSLRRRIMRPSHTVVKSERHHIWCFRSRANPISRGRLTEPFEPFSAIFRRIPWNTCGQPVETVCTRG